MSARKPICDFCNAPDPAWAYPTTDFTMPAEGTPDFGSHGGWAACIHCAALIERGVQDQLARRIAKKLARLHGGTTKVHMRGARELVAEFFKHRRDDKPRVAIDPDNPSPIDPTREDEWGRMMQSDARELTITTERPVEVQGDGRTFSEESLEGVRTAMDRWVASRIMRRMDFGEGLPQKLKVRVQVELDDEGEPGLDPEVWHLIDGSNRRAA